MPDLERDYLAPGAVRVVDNFLEGHDLKRVEHLLRTPGGDKVILNATCQHFEPPPEYEPFLEEILGRIRSYAEAHVQLVQATPSRYFLDWYVLRRYVATDSSLRKVRPHTDSEQPGRCLSATLHLGDEMGVLGGVFQTYRCVDPKRCEGLTGHRAYTSFLDEGSLRLAEEVPYKRGRLVLFSAHTPHGVSELQHGQRDVLFVWLACTPSLRAAAKGHLAVAEALVAAGAETNEEDVRGSSPLHQAVNRGHVDVAKFLLSVHGKVDFTDRFGRQALHLAAASGHVGLLELLLKRRANMCSKDSRYNRPLEAARQANQSGAEQYLVSFSGRTPCPMPITDSVMAICIALTVVLATAMSLLRNKQLHYTSWKLILDVQEPK